MARCDRFALRGINASDDTRQRCGDLHVRPARSLDCHGRYRDGPLERGKLDFGRADADILLCCLAEADRCGLVVLVTAGGRTVGFALFLVRIVLISFGRCLRGLGFFFVFVVTMLVGLRMFAFGFPFMGVLFFALKRIVIKHGIFDDRWRRKQLFRLRQPLARRCNTCNDGQHQ